MLDFLAQLDIAVTNAATGATVFQGKADQQYGPAGTFLPLGDYRSGETVTLNVALSVPITLDNSYANRVGEIDWQFLVEAFDHSQLTVVKQWSQDSGADHSEDSVTVKLLRDGEIAQTVTLNQANNWTYTFEKRMEGGLIEKDYASHTWTVEETPVPEGYRVEYMTTDDGSTVVIHNIGPGDEPPIEYVDLTVVKAWGTIRDGITKPNYVTVGVYDEDGTRQLTAILSPENNWTHTFGHIPSTWYVKEYNVPYGFTPSYYRSGNVVTVTNSTSLIQTGQLNYVVVGPTGCGTVSPTSEKLKVLTGTAYGSTAAASENFRFIGWFKNEACTDPVDASWVVNDHITPVKTENYGTTDEEVLGYEAATYYAKFEYDLTDLTIVKEGWEAIDENQSFIFEVTGSDIGTMTVVIKGRGQVTIAGLRVNNTYTVKEITKWSWRYTPDAEERSATLVAGEGVNKVTFNNTRAEKKWLNGGAYDKNVFDGTKHN